MKPRAFNPALSMATMLLFAAGCASVAPPAETPAAGATYSDSSAAWARLDSDGNDYLDQDELWQQRALVLLQDFGNADRDQDARVSRAEWDRWWPQLDRSERHPGFAAPGVTAAGFTVTPSVSLTAAAAGPPDWNAARRQPPAGHFHRHR